MDSTIEGVIHLTPRRRINDLALGTSTLNAKEEPVDTTTLLPHVESEPPIVAIPGSVRATPKDPSESLLPSAPPALDVFDLADVGLLVADATGRLSRVNKEFAHLVGRRSSDLIGTSLTSLTHPDDAGAGEAFLTRLLAEKSDDPTVLTKRYLGSDGVIVWVDLNIRTMIDEKNNVSCFFVQAFNVTTRNIILAASAFDRSHDRLTDLSNRAAFLDEINHAFATLKQPTNQIAVVLLDVDDFKNVNDSLGHVLGDELLVGLSRRLVAASRVKDTVARVGGDEFAVFIEASNARECAEELAKRVEKKLRLPFTLGGHVTLITVSVGIAVSDADHDASALLRDADLAMYLAKKNGKGRYEFAVPGLKHAALQRFEIVEDLRHAVENHEFEVFYQAIVNTSDATIAGVEALVRWNHPTRGLVSPDLFIELAETHGLIDPIGKWVRQEVCRQLAAWRDADLVDDDFYVSINVSPRQLRDPALAWNIARELEVAALPPRSLVLEITESELMMDFDVALARLRELKEIGLRLALDDYGTGYSSLARFSELPIDMIKIAKSFVDALGDEKEGRAIVQSIIDAARALGKLTVAEGVEEQVQREALGAMGCDFVQGYLFSKPLSAFDVEFALRHLRPGASTASTSSELLH